MGGSPWPIRPPAVRASRGSGRPGGRWLAGWLVLVALLPAGGTAGFHGGVGGPSAGAVAVAGPWSSSMQAAPRPGVEWSSGHGPAGPVLGGRRAGDWPGSVRVDAAAVATRWAVRVVALGVVGQGAASRLAAVVGAARVRGPPVSVSS